MASEIDVGAFAALREERGTCVETGSVSLALFRQGDQAFALENPCPHRGGPLGEGDVKDGIVYCPLHAWGFDLRTGQCQTLRRVVAKTYPARVVEGRVLVEVSEASRETVDPEVDFL